MNLLKKTILGIAMGVAAIGSVQAAYTDYVGAGHSTGLTVTASSTDDSEPSAIVDGSGLTNNAHSTNYLEAWQSHTTAPNPNSSRGNTHWIKIDLGENYNLADLWYWNYNETCCTGRGLNQVAIDYSTDNVSWSNLGTYQFNRASGNAAYTGIQGPDFNGATARYVLMTGLSNHGDTFSSGLSEIKINVAQNGGASHWVKINDNEMAHIDLEGAWGPRIQEPAPNDCNDCFGQNFMTSDGSWSITDFRFKGSKVRLLGRTASTGGTAIVSIDGVEVNNAVSFNSPTTQGNVVVFESATLSDEDHVLTIEQNASDGIYIDGYEVLTSSVSPEPSGTFRAFHTKLRGHLTDTSTGPYPDIVVDMPNGGQLQFARSRSYLPVWIAAGTPHNIDDVTPSKHNDADLRSTYARIIENTASKIVVHVRYFEWISYPTLKSELNTDPVSIDGFSSVVNEIFTILPNHTITRQILNGTNTKYESWSDPGFAATQNITLSTSGVNHGPIIQGTEPNSYPGVSGNSVKSMPVSAPTPVRSWAFDDGLNAHKDLVTENQTGGTSIHLGLMEFYKKGVSGTGLAFDGYTNEVRHSQSNAPAFGTTFAVEAWIAPNAYPWNTAPIVHRSTSTGGDGFYLGLDAYGKVVFKLNGVTATSNTTVPVWKWSHVVGTYDGAQMQIHIDGVASGSAQNFTGDISETPTDILIGRNETKASNTDPVRPNSYANLEFLFGFEGLIDEVRLYNSSLSNVQITDLYNQFKPNNVDSDLAKPVLPGQNGVGTFGATYSNLPFSEIWDRMWRTYKSDVTIKFDNDPGSVVFWRGTNGAPSWVAENNKWMADQSSEIMNLTYGLAEHMADKQNRYGNTTVLSSNPARIKLRWRDTSADLGYYKIFNSHVYDELFTIYPDAVGVRNVTYYSDQDAGFHDIQAFSNPGETALDVVPLNAITLADNNKNEHALVWSKTNGVANIPEPPPGFMAYVQRVNFNPNHAVFVIKQAVEAVAEPWGTSEQSPYTADPFAGPWNHWPISFTPSDGRFVSNHDRVTHYALSTNSPLYTVMYKIGSGNAASQVDLAKSWDDPAEALNVTGARSLGYKKITRAYSFYKTGSQVSFTLGSEPGYPLVNPAFEIKNWGSATANASIGITGATSNDIRQGIEIEPDGSYTLVVWAKLAATTNVTVTIN